MHNLFKLLKVLLLSFIIMTGTNNSNTPQQSYRLTAVNKGSTTAQNQGTEAEQFDTIELAAQQAAQLTAATGTNLQQQDDVVHQQQQDDVVR